MTSREFYFPVSIHGPEEVRLLDWIKDLEEFRGDTVIGWKSSTCIAFKYEDDAIAFKLKFGLREI